MKVLDMLNHKWYEKEDLIKESYEVFLKDLDINDFDNEKDRQKQAMITAKEYVKENSLTMSEVAQWVKEHE